MFLLQVVYSPAAELNLCYGRTLTGAVAQMTLTRSPCEHTQVLFIWSLETISVARRRHLVDVQTHWMDWDYPSQDQKTGKRHGNENGM